MFHVVPISLSMAFNVFVGNMIGARRTCEAGKYVRMGEICGIIWGIVSASVMIGFK